MHTGKFNHRFMHTGKMHVQKTYIMHTGKIHVQIIMKGAIKIYSREHSIPECLNFVVQDWASDKYSPQYEADNQNWHDQLY